MVHKKQRWREAEIKNENGLMTANTELNKYSKTNEPDIIRLTYIKLDKSIECLNIGD